jgi:hypothetical protein
MELVNRTRSETDRRVVLVEVTSRGIELFDKVNERLTLDALQGYDQLSDEDLETVEQLFQYKLRMRVGQHQAQEADIETEMDKLRQFCQDPISYSKLGKIKPE